MKKHRWNKVRRYDRRVWDDYKTAQNDYIKIRRKEEIKFQKNIQNKGRDEPKVFH